jgi:hypothetical protein
MSTILNTAKKQSRDFKAHVKASSFLYIWLAIGAVALVVVARLPDPNAGNNAVTSAQMSPTTSQYNEFGIYKPPAECGRQEYAMTRYCQEQNRLWSESVDRALR